MIVTDDCDGDGRSGSANMMVMMMVMMMMLLMMIDGGTEELYRSVHGASYGSRGG